ncbi:MAG: MaoC/PaaZ C-terminal domain-containing protein [Candidatus Azotimanducaceae bacterium]
MTTTTPFLLATARQRIGEKIGISPWVLIDQVQVNVFGEVTRWRTPGHCDVEHGKATPYGGTLMHGFHAISLITHFYKSSELWPEDGRDPLNYGLDKVRILQPIVIGDGVRLRSHISLLDAQPKTAGDMLLKTRHEIEVQGLEGSAVYAEYLTYWHAA